MNHFYETANLELRVCSEAQAPLIAEFYKRNYEDFAKYEALIEDAMTAAFHRRTLEYENRLFSKGKYIRLYMFEKGNPLTIVGTLSYRDIRSFGIPSCTIGYKVDKEYRRRGYAREAILLGDSIMFNRLKIKRIEATVLPENIPSIKLLESIGYHVTGKLKRLQVSDSYKDHQVLVRKNNFI